MPLAFLTFGFKETNAYKHLKLARSSEKIDNQFKKSSKMLVGKFTNDLKTAFTKKYRQ
ncbi:MAG: hypothetical protein ACTSWN_16555 [Promethearchaeota archaeon]